MSFARVMLVAATLLASPGARLRGQEEPYAAEEATLRQTGIQTDGPGLLEFFRQQTLTNGDRVRVSDLIRQLDDDSFEVRERASAELLEFGAAAGPLLRQAAKSSSLEVARRAEKCLKKIDKTPDDVVAAAARLVAFRKPAGAVQVLLAYLPSADDEQEVAAVQAALAAVSFRNGGPDQALLQSLDDALPARRAAAAEALCRAGKWRQVPAVRRLLKDPDPEVRLRVAMVLAGFREEQAVPVLIASLVDAGLELALQADDYLRRLAGPQAPTAALGTTQASRRGCQEAWTAWWRTADSRVLLETVRKGTPSESDREKTAALIRLLGDEDFAVRDKASAELVELGAVAVPLLQRALKDPDAEVAYRAQTCLDQIDKGPNPGVPAAAARLLAFRKPPGAAAALLAYLPFAEEGMGIEEIQDALTALAFEQGQPEPALVRALEDKLSVRRAVAAVALSRAGGDRPVPVVLELLKDPDAGVRLPVALALAEQKYKEAVPVLIALLGELPSEQLWQAEELLRRLAGPQAPSLALGASSDARQKCRDAWAAWWRNHGATVDFARLDEEQPSLGLTLVVCYDGYNGTGRVWEFGADRKPRWEITNARYPIDAHVLPGNRVLIAEYNGFVTERDFKGKILWEHRINGNPIACQRLPNGNTFVATMNNVMEITRAGKEVYSHPAGQGQITGAERLRNGHILYITMGGMLVELDERGKEVKSTQLGTPTGEWMTFELLPRQHYLVPRQSSGKLTEYDANGKVVWEGSAPAPYSAVRLANGNFIVGSMNTSRLMEVDRAGKLIWTENLQGRPFKVRRR